MKLIFISITIILMTVTIFFGKDKDELKVGDKAPDFKLPDANGKFYSLSDYYGKNPVVLYFYPKASTPGCTKQACGIRDDWSKFEKNGIQVFGVSVDSKEAIKKFIDEYGLNFPLLSDKEKKVCKSYGVLNLLGFAKRVTFIIDKEGRIAHIIDNVDVNTHSKDVFEIASKLK